MRTGRREQHSCRLFLMEVISFGNMERHPWL